MCILPGVPHFGKIYGDSYSNAARPKSTILRIFWGPFESNNKFSGFKSLCIIYLLAQYATP